MTQRKLRLMSGMRPTGELHLGNYLGALENWVTLQDEYECYFSVVDLHALTTAYAETEHLQKRMREMVLDWLAAGLDPDKCAIFVQSEIKEIAELHTLFSMVTPLPWLERVPTYKDQLQQLKEKEINTYGFLGYPLLQAADILICQAEVVPVGEDQLPHLELTREVARRFNHLYNAQMFPEPEARLNKIKLLPGLDNRKMSKSYQNYLAMTASTDVINTKVRSMVTDPGRIQKTDPGNPDICAVYAYHKIFNEPNAVDVEQNCKAGTIGCVDCKKRLANVLHDLIGPMHDRKEELLKRPDYVRHILDEGAVKMRKMAQQTIEQVREIMGLKWV